MVEMRQDILKLLSGGDKRSIAKVNAVVSLIEQYPKKFESLFQFALSDDELVKMRALDAIEKITRSNISLLQPYKKQIINEIALSSHKEIKWHVAQLLPRLKLTVKEKAKIVDLLINNYLQDKSSIVKTCALQALSDLALDDKSLKLKVVPIIKKSIKTGTPAMQARAKKLLLNLH